MSITKSFLGAFIASVVLSLGMVACSSQQLQQISTVAQRVPSDPNAALLLATKTADTVIHDLHTARLNGAITKEQEKPYLAQVAKAESWISIGATALATTGSNTAVDPETMFTKAITLLYQISNQLQLQQGTK